MRCNLCLHDFEFSATAGATAHCPVCGTICRVPEQRILVDHASETLSTRDDPSDGSQADSESSLDRVDSQMETQIASGPDAVLPPATVVGRFTIRRHVGRGGFGDVYEAFDPHLNRRVAIKVSRAGCDAKNRSENVLREARAAAKLKHPHIVTIYEAIWDRDAVCMITDFIDGNSLNQIMRKQSIDVPTAIRWTIQVARALAYSHGLGIVHRDIKPGNILIDRHQNAFLTDFGLAKLVDADVESIMAGQAIVGTPAYMAPEQARGDSLSIDSRTDVYSLGIVLYEMLAGRRPFLGNTGQILEQIVTGETPSLRSIKKSIPADLAAVCHKAISLDPADRFQSADEFADDLERFVTGKSTVARPQSRWRQLVSTLNFKPILISLAVMSLLFLGAVLLLNRPATDSQIISNDPNGVHVNLRVEPMTTRIALVPLSSVTGEPVPEGAITPSVADTYRFQLRPGFYIIEARRPLPQDFFEVVRYVPPREIVEAQRGVGSGRLTESNATSWDVIDGIVTWPILNFRQAPTPKLISVPGGVISVFARGPTATRTPREVRIPDFAIAEREVTVGEFEAVMGYIPHSMNQRFPDGVPQDIPVTNVTYYQALQYCELVGGRLPTFFEYLYVATNGGTTRFPWGDDASLITDWPLDVSAPDYDRTLHPKPIWGLYSGPAEWTQSGFFEPHGPAHEALGIVRVIAGGGNSVAHGKPVPELYRRGPAYPDYMPLVGVQELHGLGFRVAASRAPRFLPRD